MDNSQPYYSANVVKIAANLNNLIDSNESDNTIIYDEYGNNILGGGTYRYTHTGTKNDGRKIVGANCNNWTTASGKTAYSTTETLTNYKYHWFY